MIRTLGAAFVLISSCGVSASHVEAARQGASPLYAISIAGGGANYLLDYTNDTFSDPPILGRPPARKTGSITIVAGTAMSPSFYQWLRKALAGNEVGAPIAIDTLAGLNKISTELKVDHPKIDTITIPELSSDSREMGSLKIKFVPDGAAMVTPRSTPVSFDPGGSVQWGKASFKLSIPGVNCAHVTKIGSITINPSNTAVKDMKVTISGDEMMDFIHWPAPKDGTLQVTGGGGNLFEVDLRGLKIMKFSGLQSATVTLSCTQTSIKFGL